MTNIKICCINSNEVFNTSFLTHVSPKELYVFNQIFVNIEIKI